MTSLPRARGCGTALARSAAARWWPAGAVPPVRGTGRRWWPAGARPPPPAPTDFFHNFTKDLTLLHETTPVGDWAPFPAKDTSDRPPLLDLPPGLDAQDAGGDDLLTIDTLPCPPTDCSYLQRDDEHHFLLHHALPDLAKDCPTLLSAASNYSLPRAPPASDANEPLPTDTDEDKAMPLRNEKNRDLQTETPTENAYVYSTEGRYHLLYREKFALDFDAEEEAETDYSSDDEYDEREQLDHAIYDFIDKSGPVSLEEMRERLRSHPDLERGVRMWLSTGVIVCEAGCLRLCY